MIWLRSQTRFMLLWSIHFYIYAYTSGPNETTIKMHVLILYSTLIQYYFLRGNLSTQFNWTIHINFNISFSFVLMAAVLELHEIHKFA